MSESVTRIVLRHKWTILIIGIAVLLVGSTYGAGAFGVLKSGGLADPRADSSREARLAEQYFPNAQVSLILLLRGAENVDQPRYRADAARILAPIRLDPAVLSVMSYYDTGDADFVSRDRRETYAIIALRGSDTAQRAAYLRLRSAVPTTSLPLTWGGPVVADYEVDRQVQRDLPRAGVISGPLLLILLLLIFRSPIAALLPMIVGALSVLGAFVLTRVLAGVIDISVFATNIISLLGLGLAIDYSLLFVSRFRDELAAGRGVEDALGTTIRTAGESIFFSGCTVAISLLGLLVFPENFLRSMGLGGALAVAMAVVASLTVLPALLAALGPRVNWGTIPIPGRSHGVSADTPGFWFRFSHWVMRRAVPVIVVTLGLLLALGIPFLHARFSNPGVVSLPAAFESRVVSLALAQDFADGVATPIQILLRMPASPVASAQLASLSRYAAQIQALPGVRGVDSLVTLDSHLTGAEYAAFYALPFNTAATAAETQYLSGDFTQMSVNYTGDSQDAAAERLVSKIRALPAPAETRVLVGGGTAELIDHLAGLRARLPLAAGLIMAATFVLLFFLLRSLVVPAKAVVLNVLSLSASFGLLTWIFQDGHGARLLAFTSSGSLDATIPVLIFALAFGLSTDYEVFLVSRIKEEYDRCSDNTDAVAIGVEKTGRIITAAALLLIVVVAAFGASKILSMKEIGVGLAIAVAIDAAIVRTLLVPATMRIFGALNWWLPSQLKTNTQRKSL